MSPVDVRRFAESDLAAAGVLLAERHRTHRAAEPLLSPRFEDPQVAESVLRVAWESEQASGAVGVRDGQVVGFLLGAPKPGAGWGPNVWVEAAGQATSEPESMRDIFAVAATRWVEEGRTAQYVIVPAHDKALVDAWFRLGLGLQHVHGIRGLPIAPATVTVGLTIRPPTRADIPVMAQLDLELRRHQSLSPTFSAVEMPSLEKCLAEQEEDFGDPDFPTFVAERAGQAVGYAIGCALDKSRAHTGPAVPDRASYLGFAAVLPEARGLGAGRALGEAVFAWSAEAGFGCVVTDWRATNLLSSRTWPRLGFRESFLRLHRLVGY
jgi:ribosomal protein S18 acetylase RimI-like enzyme